MLWAVTGTLNQKHLFDLFCIGSPLWYGYLLRCILMPVTAEGKKSNQHSSADSLAAQIYFETVQAARQSSHLSQVYCSSNFIKSSKYHITSLLESQKLLGLWDCDCSALATFVDKCRNWVALIFDTWRAPTATPPLDTSWLYTPLALRVHWNRGFLYFQNHFRL